MSETNGSSRLDRIEEILERHSTMLISHDMAMARIDASIERQVLANEAAHELFEAEDKRLLTAQILMNGAMQKMNGAMEKIAGAMEKMAENMSSLELKMEETTGKLNALIDTVDGIIRNNAAGRKPNGREGEPRA